jgi:hypothetical protein
VTAGFFRPNTKRARERVPLDPVPVYRAANYAPAPFEKLPTASASVL